MNQIKMNIDNGVAVMSINRPEALNALNREIVDEMDDFLEQLKRYVDVRVLVLYSENNFAAGADIKVMANLDEAEARDFVFSRTYNKLEALDIPTIACIEGYALGGGLELALACDMRFAADNARFGFPEVTLGIMPGDGGTVRLPAKIGDAKAKELIFTGDVIGAEEALEVGLISRIYSKDALLKETLRFARKIAARAPIAVRTAKKTIRRASAVPSMVDGIKIETDNWVKLFKTEDQKEGMKAFIEKRKPVFKNR